MAVNTSVRTEQRLKTGSRPWVNSGVIQLSKKKKQLLKRLKNHPNNLNILSAVKKVSHDLVLLKRRTRSEFIQKKFSDGYIDSKKCWDGINAVLGRSKKSDGPTRLISSDALITDNVEMANELNKCFVEQGQLPPRPQAFSILQHGPEWNPSTMLLFNTDEHEVFRLLSSLQIHKSIGPDGISNFVLKNCAEELTRPLTMCIQKCLSSGVYPDCLKLARVAPIFKSGSKELCTNYRPISVLSSINKIYESIIAVRLKGFMKTKNILYEHQYGFRETSGTGIAVTEAMDFIHGNLDKRDCKVVSALMLDLRKAFDSVSHTLLLRKLYVMGVRGLSHDLFKSYLSNRKQFVQLRGAQSSHRAVKTGVPQGSVLGPILFLIFLNDMARLPLFGKLYLFADDACLLYAGVSDTINVQRANEDLVILDQYFGVNCLALNVNKTKIIHFHDFRKQLERRLTVSLNGAIVEEVRDFCYLGVYLDSNLNWKRHVDYLCEKLSRIVGIFYRIRDEVPLYILRRMYFALVHSHLMYMVTLWGNAPITYLKRLQSLQNRIFKLMYRLPVLTPTLTLFQDHVKNILPVKGLQVLSICKFVKQSIQNNIYHTLMFPYQQGIEASRDPQRLGRQRALTGWGLRSISFQGPTFYNNLPRDLRNIKSTSLFSKKLKIHLLGTHNLARLLTFQYP